MIKTFLRNMLKPLSFLPALFMMYLIFRLSGQNGTESSSLSMNVSIKLVKIAAKILNRPLSPEQLIHYANLFHFLIRKCAHVMLYFLLAVSVSFPLYVYGLRGLRLMVIAGAFCIAFACSDEYHQSLVDARGPSVKDVLIDSIGIFFGILTVRIVGFIGRMTIFRPLAKKKPAA